MMLRLNESSGELSFNSEVGGKWGVESSLVTKLKFEQKLNMYLEDPSVPVGNAVQVLQNSWEKLPTGNSFSLVGSGSQYSVWCYKLNETYGSALLMSYDPTFILVIKNASGWIVKNIYKAIP